MSTEGLLVYALLYGVVPAWLVAGFVDYLCHRHMRIEDSAGVMEVLLHIAQFAAVGLPLLAVLFLQVNAAVILIMLAGLLLHQALAVIDVRYADSRRHIPPIEQHVHGVLEMLPWIATFLVIVLHWQEMRSLLGLGTISAVWQLEPKHQPLDEGYLVVVLAGVLVLGVLPYGEELVRAVRQHRLMQAHRGAERSERRVGSVGF